MGNRFLIVFLLISSGLAGQSFGDAAIKVGEKISIYSKILDEKRELYIYEPPGFWGMDDAGENLPVVFVLDGESQFQNSVSTIHFLSSSWLSQIPSIT